MTAYDRHLKLCDSCRSKFGGLPEDETLRRPHTRLHHGGPVVKVRQNIIGSEPPAYREVGLSTDSVAYFRIWAEDVRVEYRRALARVGFFRHLGAA